MLRPYKGMLFLIVFLMLFTFTNSAAYALSENDYSNTHAEFIVTRQEESFDKFAVFGNQLWGINYVTTGESFTNMNNISSTFFVLELSDLFTNDITTQVRQFINGTKN